ncbi:2-C-methyl-D-erythritol 4-phosphate cytidylyltransferase [Thermosipho melanesiensis]|uniref:2-C-methyl-D-erythritol 4-phosphate cytidylyltransferase n=2 Tax=Thermosipho melanesiensis TaxID=46541 RepID=ISPD_THEM4|nr:2-C-methyl-D-erythritol 4-phosphate cytidylyltransferase [Thermosipho melanesiensis]A6LPA6.1 RecName: Full=2-C-methyl-D-erythritol 4-phosphate cytidylyltransferase; AltName: Full=4-diphosphocytidyl-2C-methyl-D-erythritol synthase; AltName: Full=MEP cytidylyltransferase; Short=MCT [Thermosipho melanesiensis BI429]ABR31757.1 4-diphosphocytidyl-2C-methyl-D-erythritol synthase [Thermosipho melanesiensis BI429]APT74779.1 2-C-methyl-D-erythritol 4-phosphate cytidylyltransferase [Thermosipho melanes
MNVAVILFGGKGERFSKDYPKQFVKFHGKTLMEHTVEKFLENFIHLIIIVVNGEYLEESKKILKKYKRKNIYVILGGKTREFSTLNAVKYLKDLISEDDNVIIHDGARPFVSKEVILRNIDFVNKYGAVVTAVPVENTIAFVENKIVKEIPPRRYLFTLQTPQTFKYSILYKSFRLIKDLEKFTDDSSVVLAAGYNVHVVYGEKTNIKITTKEDLYLIGVEKIEGNI